ncbi:ribbon-helix-helix protein, CopG family [Holosporaceae bacterium 'Namur']|nr:ribbon-helix-helix protein, CopG family [Holosporaceae bacterium 'Namur']
MITVRLPDEIEKRLEVLAIETGRTKTYYIKEAILSHIEDMEDRYLAVQRLEHPKKSLSMQEAKRALGLDS